MTTVGRRKWGCVRGVTGGRLEKLDKEKNWRRNVTIALLVGQQTNDEQGKLG